MTKKNTSLTQLADFELDEKRARMLEQQQAACRGQAPWRQRKLAETRCLLALDELVERVTVLDVDARTELRALITLECPVPCKPEGEDEVVLASECALALSYPEEAMRSALPGHAFVGIVHPRDVWLPHVSHDDHQRLCIGAHVVPCTSVLQILLAAWGAISMQAVRLDPRAPEGVMNGAALRHWMARQDCLPLTTEPFHPQGGQA